MYHHLGVPNKEDDALYYISRENFILQLDLIQASKFHILTLKELEQAFVEKRKLPKRSVLITFDDGWMDNYKVAFPIIKERKIPITIFLSSDLLDVESDILTSEQVKEMQQSNWVEFASHGANHLRLRTLSNEHVESELLSSKAKIENLIGTPVHSFCYPFGSCDRRVRKMMFKAGYLLDFGTRKGVNLWPWIKHRPLLRAHVSGGESLKEFKNELYKGRK